MLDWTASSSSMYSSVLKKAQTAFFSKRPWAYWRRPKAAKTSRLNSVLLCPFYWTIYPSKIRHRGIHQGRQSGLVQHKCSPKVISWRSKPWTWPIKERERYVQLITCEWLKPRMVLFTCTPHLNLPHCKTVYYSVCSFTQLAQSL